MFSFLLAFLLPIASHAGGDAAGFAQLLADKVKETKPVLLLNLEAKPAASAFLPVWTFHDIAGVDYVEWGVGGKWQQGEKANAYTAIDLNLVGISGRIWGFEWAKSHVKRSIFPPIFVGPSIGLPLDVKDIRGWTWKKNLYLIASVRFGGTP